MGKPVNNLSFWKARILDAEKHGEPRYSVYLTSEQDWEHLNAEHEKIFQKEIQPGDKVLDAGCGYGRWAPRFEDYYGVDFSGDFIDRAKQAFPDKKFIKGDLARMPYFGNHEFDVAFCVSMRAMIVGNLGQAAWDAMEKELKRVAKKVLILEYSSPQNYFIL